MKHLFCLFALFVPAIAIADDTAEARVRVAMAMSQAKSPVIAASACKCGASCPCDVGQCDDGGCPTFVAAKSMTGIEDTSGYCWQRIDNDEQALMNRNDVQIGAYRFSDKKFARCKVAGLTVTWEDWSKPPITPPVKMWTPQIPESPFQETIQGCSGGSCGTQQGGGRFRR